MKKQKKRRAPAAPARDKHAQFVIEPVLMRKFHNEVTRRVRESGMRGPIDCLYAARGNKDGYMLLERTLLTKDAVHGAWHLAFGSPDGRVQCRHVSEKVLRLTLRNKEAFMAREGDEDLTAYRQAELEAENCRFMLGAIEEGRALPGGPVHIHTPGGE